MRFYRYGIDLERLEAKHLEIVRHWRNQNVVRLRMRYQKEISASSQSDWFKKLDPSNDWYFVAVQNELPFGMFQIKEVDWTGRVGQAGGFVSKAELIGGTEAGFAILALMDFAFLVLDLYFLEASYHRDHQAIVLLNRQLGYETFAVDSDGFVRARVSANGYFQATEKLRLAAVRTRGPETRLTGAAPWLVARIKKLNRNGSPLLRGITFSTDVEQSPSSRL